jgi:hypothetical protein
MNMFGVPKYTVNSIRFPERFSAVHNVFHVTQLKKGVHVPETEMITEANAWIESDFLLIEHPMRVLDQRRGRPEDRP